MASLHSYMALSCLAFLHIGFALGGSLWKQGETLPKVSKSESCLNCASLSGPQFNHCLERHCTPTVGHSGNYPALSGKCSELLSIVREECDNEFDKIVNSAEAFGAKSLSSPVKRIWGDPLEVCIGTRCNGMMGNNRRMCIINRCYNA